jgi:hypothetical protein
MAVDSATSFKLLCNSRLDGNRRRLEDLIVSAGDLNGHVPKFA